MQFNLLYLWQFLYIFYLSLQGRLLWLYAIYISYATEGSNPFTAQFPAFRPSYHCRFTLTKWLLDVCPCSLNCFLTSQNTDLNVCMYSCLVLAPKTVEKDDQTLLHKVTPQYIMPTRVVRECDDVQPYIPIIFLTWNKWWQHVLKRSILVFRLTVALRVVSCCSSVSGAHGVRYFIH